MRTVLLTGFSPFDGAERNPSAEAVELVAAGWDRDERLVVATLPVAFERARDELARLTAEHSPALVVATGLAGGRTGLTVERVAVNLADARIPDDDGHRPAGEPLDPDGPDAYLMAGPVKAAAAAATAAGAPTGTSLTAGAYVGNAVAYHLGAWSRSASGRRAAFVHVPWDEQGPVGAPQTELAAIAAGIRAVVETFLDAPDDLVVADGPTH
ncbi:pyroglutamyl-peptidase I [Sanguibacter sp. HDW7]|uniref:pyroglutamyl-peptidase I family protein n=1 Tax=Sanguibacter sp. HDW7 TaxID=2714931 RepID=UPI00140910C7|nr:pyroglutamyl-peptidase I [Sanguibacter sp. HDW7]QIK84049.1 pyroglutamyl-peptidase I [Sanguibacter sp. HDW7]